METKEEHFLLEFDKVMLALYNKGDFDTLYEIAEETIALYPNSFIVYQGAARLYKYYSEKLADDYFTSKNILGMSFQEWRSGEGTPYWQFVELRCKAANYLKKVIELRPDLPSETVAALREKIDDLLH